MEQLGHVEEEIGLPYVYAFITKEEFKKIA